MKKDWTTGLKDKMSDYSERPSDRVWSNIAGQTGIEAPVREKRERLLPVWLWTSAASAAAIMAGIFILLRHIQPEMQYISAMKIEEVAPVPVNTRNTDEIVSTGNADESDIIVVNADMADKRNDAMMTATANPLHKTSRSNAAEVRQHSAMAAFANKDEGNRLAVAENADFGRSTVEENTEKVSTEAENATYEAESAAYDTGNADHEAAPAEDILQDSFVKIFSSIGTFSYKGPGSLKAWMSRIAANEALQYLRKQKHTNFLEYTDNIPDRTDEEEEPDIGKIPAGAIQKLIEELPDGYRTIFNLFVFEEKSHKEIAGLLGITESTSASQFHRARRILAKKIKDYEKGLDNRA
uniref:RNA polymerase sigma factor 70 region 4 type 2 domain-containing protein n=1 Tax=uncultured prokaryote TaxID=198431 RepID=A0A0H5Q472_9ZZZZ|nr:hypothetical protein [uncultured prokaryote]